MNEEDSPHHPRIFEYVEIIPNMYLGDWVDAHKFREAFPNGGIVCVHEDHNLMAERSHYAPIMVWLDKECRSGYASREMLDAATSIMGHYVRRNQPVLVHCYGGVERSPLTTAWFLRRYQHFHSLPRAFEHIRGLRPIVEDRLHWLNPPRKEESE